MTDLAAVLGAVGVIGVLVSGRRVVFLAGLVLIAAAEVVLAHAGGLRFSAKIVAALAKYASQQHRRYSDSEYIRNVARTHGINVNREYAEVFEVYRVVA